MANGKFKTDKQNAKTHASASPETRTKAEWHHPQAIVECGWLKAQLENISIRSSIRIFDCSTYLHFTDDHPKKPYEVKSGLIEYKKCHIPNSAYLDLQADLSEANSPYRFTLPALEDLAKRFSEHGIGAPFHIVLYSRNGLQWASRIWWMLHLLGYEKVSILNGGMAEWLHQGLPTETAITRFEKADFLANTSSKKVVFKKDILKVLDTAIDTKTCILLNALTSDIHAGKSTRYGRKGRIPTSLNIPFHDFLNADMGKLIAPEQARQRLLEKNITPDQKIIHYCGGGIAATLNYFVLYQLGYLAMALYDHSMSEWALDAALPIETD